MRDDLQVPSDAEDQVRLGRPRDPSRDAAILTATLDLLGEVGYERVTVRAIAQRSGTGLATIYRRWPTKEELVAGAVASLKNESLFDPAPGSDPYEVLIAAVTQFAGALHGDRPELVPNLIGQLSNNPALAEALRARVVLPRLEAVTALIAALPGVDPERAREAAELFPALLFFRKLVMDRTPTETDIRQLVELAIRSAR